MTYSRFMDGLAKAGVEVDRKILSDLAVKEPESFAALVGHARTAVAAPAMASRRGSPSAAALAALPRERIGVRGSTRAMNGSRASDSGFGTDAGRREFARGPVGAGRGGRPTSTRWSASA